MTDREALIAAIAASPADDLPRLVFADWLDDHGDPAQAEFIRAHVRLYRTRPGTGEYAAIARRCDDLMRANCGEWLQTICEAFGCEPPRFAPPQPSGWQTRRESPSRLKSEAGHTSNLHSEGHSYRIGFDPATSGHPDGSVILSRGFIDRVVIPSRETSRIREPGRFELVLRSAPIVEIRAFPPENDFDWLTLGGRRLASVKYLTLYLMWEDVDDVTRGDHESVLNSEHLTGVSALHLFTIPDFASRYYLSGRGGNSPFMRSLRPSPLLNRARVLRVPFCDPTLAALSDVSSLPKLEELAPSQDVSTYYRMDWSLLPAIPLRETLRRLSLKACRLTDDAMLAITRVRRWDKLTHLRLDQNQIADRGVAGMCRTCVFPEVRFLNLSDNQIGDLGAVAIARSGIAQTVRFLDLTKNRLTATGAIPLAAALAEGPLELLKLTARPLGRRTVRRVSEMLGRRVRFE